MPMSSETRGGGSFARARAIKANSAYQASLAMDRNEAVGYQELRISTV